MNKLSLILKSIFGNPYTAYLATLRLRYTGPTAKQYWKVPHAKFKENTLYGKDALGYHVPSRVIWIKKDCSLMFVNTITHRYYYGAYKDAYGTRELQLHIDEFISMNAEEFIVIGDNISYC